MDGHILHITEAHKDVGPIVIDFDFRQHTQERVYTDQVIDNCVRGICEIACHYVAVDSMTVYLLEKGDQPRPHPKNHGMFKDGVHIIIPDVVTTPHVQRLMRKRFIERHGDILSKLPNVTNSIQDIYDESVIHSSGWLMYGSRKPGEDHAWRVTRVWDVQRCNGTDVILSQLPSATADDPSLVSILSIRFNKSPEAKYTDAYAAETMPVNIINTSSGASSASVVTSLTVSHDRYYEQASALVGLLNAERADAEPSWIRVGWCLHNVEHSDRMRILWESFSRLSPKFDPVVCKTKWDTMKTVASGLDISSLHMWAKHDNPDEYAVS